MRRVRDLVEQVRGARRSIGLLTVLALSVALATAAQTAMRDGDVLTSAATDQIGAARSAPKVVTSPDSTTTTSSTTTTTAAPPPTEPAPVETTAAPAPAAPQRTRPSAPAATDAPAPTHAPAPALAPPAAAAVPTTRCLVRLHGKGGSGGGTHQAGGITIIQPSGNAPGWGGRQWLYFAPSSYAAAAGPIIAAVDAAGCGQVIVNGFSNGGAMAMKLYCSGETFGGRLVGVVVDDPVPDHGSVGCARPSGVALTVYWTGALEHPAQPGWSCAEQDWTCEGGTTVGIGAYAASAGVGPKTSPHSSHTWYTNAPETQAWR